jgi:multicomponent Na+:H+ antiporter subunit D
MNLRLILPIVIPLLTAAAALLSHRSREAQRWISLAGAAALFAAAIALLSEVSHRGILATQMGDWPAPYGITLVADLFSAVMVALAGLIGLSVALYSLASVDRAHEAFGFHPLYHFLLMGVCGAFLTGDIFNLYVWFEVMLTASFVLLALGGERAQMEGAIKYMTLNLFSSALFLTAVGILYGLAGTLNMADLARKFSTLEALHAPVELTAVALLFLVAFSIKAAVFPLFFWLPASYHTPPVAVTAVFSGLLTKVGVYAVIRLFTTVFVQEAAALQSLILAVAGFTMVTGVLGAVAQYEFRRLLSFHIISQIGYPLMGLGLLSPAGLGAAIYFTFHVSVAKAALFLVSGLADRLEGTFELKKLGGLYRSQPLLAALFFVAAMALAGMPPLSGFFAKLGLVRAGLDQSQYAIVGVALAVSLLTLFSMIKIWNEAFWKPAPSNPAPRNATSKISKLQLALYMGPIALLAAVAVILGIFAEPFFALALRAGEQLIDRSGYIRAVLGGP